MALYCLGGSKVKAGELSVGTVASFIGYTFTITFVVQNFIFSLIGGVVLVLFIHSLNTLVGCVSISWPTTPSYSKMFASIGRGLVTATGLALVEELLFRSWLPDEIAVDLGYHRGVILSGLIFSLSQRSIWTIPGLWLLSLGMAGVRQRSQDNLSLPIGLRAGIMASSWSDWSNSGFILGNTFIPKATSPIKHRE